MGHLLLRNRSLKRLLSIGKKTDEEHPKPTGDVSPQRKLAWRCFSYREISQATGDFNQDNLVGRGGYAEVYKGILLADRRAIAVKRLNPAALTDGKREKEFLTELGTVSHVSHPNVSRLLGCCVENGLHLIFELSSTGSVSSNLHDESKPIMTWKQRFNIAVGTARGLQYLHKGCQRRIIHRDIKASNVLLTDHFEPQISDFGLARWLPSEWSHHAIAPIEGTFGCLAPEYYTHGIVDEKTDVFAFGVFLLEVISGKKPVDRSHKSLLSWAKPYLNDGSIQAMVDPRIGDDYDLDQLKRLTFVASLCIRASASWRPTMTEVLELLEGTGEISPNRWQMPEAEQEEEEFWDFYDLDDDSNSPSSSSSSNRSIGKYLSH
ncbi:putative receptor-like serine/threonine-protein kinase [Carex littledalei]|uniref:Putative receptor-like serine/threonine-protein kinase n=1 Tax=Carex littledalei TaxID=544730 RepID=A0A833R5V8_9POAL|nr:putative receptor-like serine/threonine-protein kinase [Carex littledalei]